MIARTLLLALLLLLTSATTCFAIGVHSQETYVLASGEIHDGDLLVSGRKVIIEGTVVGDVYAFAENILVSGKVTGDLLTFSRNTEIRGEVDGNIRAFTDQLTIDGHVTRNLTLFAQYLSLSELGEIDGNILTLAKSVDLKGRLGREFNGAVAELRITGEVGRGIPMLRVGQLHIEPTAHINGDVHYASPHAATIAPEANISGEVTFHQVHPKPERKKSFFWPLFLTFASLISTLLIWLVIRYLFPSSLSAIHRTLQDRWASKLGVGFVLLLALPMLLLVLVITLIGIPLAITLAAGTGVMLYVAKVFIGSWAGIRLTERLGWRISPLLAELLGVVVVSLLVQLPFVGWVLAAVIWALFFGATISAVRQINRSAL